MKEFVEINPKEVKEYYVDQRHSLSQTAEHFGRSESGMEKFLKRNGIKKKAEAVIWGAGSKKYLWEKEI